jgi:hypothetical protein
MKKLKCKRIEQELTNFMERNLDSPLYDEIESHIQSCEKCKILLETTRKMLNIFRDEEVFGKALAEFEKIEEPF